MATQAQLTLFSPAKINLHLNILGKRPDGYHELETVMLPLEFGDRIILQMCKTEFALECNHPQLPVDDTNLTLRAAKQIAQRFGVEQGLKITLQKHIPLASGLAGGSSNAATVLMGLNQLWSLGATLDQLGELAAAMGSDINFFLHGGAAICRGRGERVQPIPCKLTAAVLLVNPGFGISTPWAYQSWAKAAGRLTQRAADVTLLARALAEDDLAGVGKGLYNALEAPSVGKFPVLQLLKDAMRDTGATGTLMSGSGATVFGLFSDAKMAKQAGHRICEQFGPSMWTQVTRFAHTAR